MVKIDLDSAVFYTNDLETIVAFYKDLGLEVEYVQPNRFASFMFPGGARLGIKQKKEEREIPGAQSVFLKVDDIESYYVELKAKGVKFRTELTVQDWGTYFSFLDPDNNKVEFVTRPQ